MDKTHNISLGGFAFIIEDKAYQRLRKYIDDISLSIKGSKDEKEIISDVEYRIAELLRERSKGREVIGISDIEYIIATMGEPEVFQTEENFEETSQTNQSFKGEKETYAYAEPKAKLHKKLFRDIDDKKIAGVCSGIGHYFGIDSTWVRLIFLVLWLGDFFVTIGSGMFIIYIVLWIVVPIAKTTTDKLQMRGEPVNVDSIKDFFQQSPETNSETRRAVSSETIFGSILKWIFRIFLGFIAFILMIVAFALLVACVSAMFGLGVAGIGLGISAIVLYDYFLFLFEHSWEVVMAYMALGILMIFPAISLILIALRLISKRYRVPRWVGFGLPGIIFIGVLMAGIVAIITGRQFTFSNTSTEKVDLSTDELVINIQDEYFNQNRSTFIFNKKLYIPEQNYLKIFPSTTDRMYAEMDYMANGRNPEDALENISEAEYGASIVDNQLNFSNDIAIKEGGKWRYQRVYIKLYLPEGKKVKLLHRGKIIIKDDTGYKSHRLEGDKVYTYQSGVWTETTE